MVNIWAVSIQFCGQIILQQCTAWDKLTHTASKAIKAAIAPLTQHARLYGRVSEDHMHELLDGAVPGNPTGDHDHDESDWTDEDDEDGFNDDAVDAAAVKEKASKKVAKKNQTKNTSSQALNRQRCVWLNHSSVTLWRREQENEEQVRKELAEQKKIEKANSAAKRQREKEIKDIALNRRYLVSG